MTKTKLLNVLENSILDSLDLEGLSDEEVSRKVVELFNLVREDCKKSSIESYKAQSSDTLTGIRDDARQFEERNLAKWKPAFDHLEMMWHVAQELGEAHGHDVRGNKLSCNNAVMAALAHLYPKALLVVQEIICLLKGGFPDGALSRWRSLHELSVTSIFISKRGETAATEYLLSFHFSARRAAHQVNKYSERSGLRSFSEEEMREFDARCNLAERILGREVGKDRLGEWPKISGKNSFADVEEDIEMDHWRPWYKWASTYTHSNHRPADKLLGLADSKQSVNLVGASNSGFIDPFQLTALTLSQLVETYLGHAMNLDRMIHIEVFQELAGEMAGIAMDAEQSSKERTSTN